MAETRTDASPHDFASAFTSPVHDPRDPDPFLALFLDRSLPIDEQAKAALVQDMRSFSRQFLHPLCKPFARFAIVLVGLFRIFVPRAWTNSKLLHRLIYWGLHWFVSPAANFLILRHFHIGSEIVRFIADNSPVPVEPSALRPRTLADVKEEIFLKHDLNLYNFVINLNSRLREAGGVLHRPERLSFDAITDGPFPIAAFPKTWHNFIDLSLAIEIYTPLYQFWLTANDFWRASNSLQLDELVAIYVATLLGDATHLSIVNNKHPLVPLSVFRAGHRLVLHGLASECLHAVLVHHKRQQKLADAQGLPGPTSHGLAQLWSVAAR